MSNISQKFPLFVEFSKKIRHTPVLESLEPLWNVLRPPYQLILRYMSKDSGLPIELEGIARIYVPASFLGGQVDPLEIPMLKKFFQTIKPETCFYDIGASIGLHTLVAGNKISSLGEIHAFEPDLPSCAQFLENISLIDKKIPIYLSKCFVSDRGSIDEVKQFSSSKYIDELITAKTSKARHLYLFEETDIKDNSQISLDAYISAGGRPPTVIKCDIEGAELLFLQGAVNTLKNYKPILFMSFHPDLIGHFHASEKDFYDFLDAQGYQWEILNEVGETHVYAYAS